MCQNPTFVYLRKGPVRVEKNPVACRVCDDCREKRTDDYIGRMMAEAQFSATTVCLTLTYAPRGDLADKVVTPSHFRAFIRAIRDANRECKVRFFAVGEYGELKGRAHFHAILFFAGPLPVWKRCSVRSFQWEHNSDEQHWPGGKKRFHLAEWPHGHIVCDYVADQRAFRYVCKYLTKDTSRTNRAMMSKRPALGAVFFAKLADRAVEMGHFPSSMIYSPPGYRGKKTVTMSGATRRAYLLRVYDGLQAAGSFRWERLNDRMRKALETALRQRHVAAAEQQPLQELVDAFDEHVARSAPSASAVKASLRASTLFLDLTGGLDDGT